MLRTLFANNIVRQLSLLVSGTAIGQLINYAAMLVILRIYGPQAFGEFGAFNAVLQLLLPLAAFSLPAALPLTTSRIESKALVSLSNLVSLGFSLMFFVFLCGFTPYFLELFSLESSANLVYLLPVALLFSARLQLAQQTLLKLQQFTVVVKAELIQAIGLNVLRILVGYCWSVSAVLITLTSVAGWTHKRLLSSVAGDPLRDAWQPLVFRPRSFRYWRRLKRTLSHYRAFPLFQTPQQLLNGAAQSVPVLILAALFGSSTVGFYVLAKTLLELPAMLLNRAIGDAFYSHFAIAYRQQGDNSHLLIKATLGLALAGVVPFGVVAVWGEALVGWLFGAEWRQSGEYAGWMAVWLYFAFINIPSVKAVMVLQIQHWAILLNLLTLGLRVSALYWMASVTGNPVHAVAAFALVGAAHCLVFTAMAISVSKLRANLTQVVDA
ncbi:oligosaccharide flippase family protein [Rheinheimera sp.]|uniref:lipopolysaccharide biosynthesis protein n=1 Tax=Rheinheimera sp. TaxID=1869214 RepID=UPI00307F85CF